MNPPEILTYINSAGVVGLLVFMLWLGLSGKVIPVQLLDQIVKATVEAILDELEERSLLGPR